MLKIINKSIQFKTALGNYSNAVCYVVLNFGFYIDETDMLVIPEFLAESITLTTAP